MAKKLKISESQTQTIREAFDDFLLQKKALGLVDKTIETSYRWGSPIGDLHDKYKQQIR